MTFPTSRVPVQHRWLSDGGTPNPAPTPVARNKPESVLRTKDVRDTAAGCRDRATADLLQALTMATGNGRKVLETSAASWTARGDMLQRIELGIEARLAKAAPDASDIELTSAEIAEDAAFLRL
ncbi:MAG: hypothetical protein ABIQ32_05440 [Sphingomicrobium sp.]